MLATHKRETKGLEYYGIFAFKSLIDYNVKPFAFQNLFAPSQKSMGNGRQTLQVLQASAGNKDVNRPVQVCSNCP